MFIVWGRKVGKSRAGQFADFCTICRDATVMTVYHCYSIRHVYFIPTGSPEYYGFETICNTCRTRVLHDWEHVRNTKPGRGNSLEALKSELPDDFARFVQPQLDLETQVRRRSLGREERRGLIIDVLAIMNQIYVREEQNLWCNPVPTLSVFIAIAGLIAFFVWNANSRLTYEDSRIRVIIALAAAAVVIGIGFWWGIRRFFRLRIQPRLVRGLRTLRPNEAELQEAIAQLRPLKFKILPKLKIPELLAGIEQSPHDGGMR